MPRKNLIPFMIAIATVFVAITLPTANAEKPYSSKVVIIKKAGQASDYLESEQTKMAQSIGDANDAWSACRFDNFDSAMRRLGQLQKNAERVVDDYEKQLSRMQKHLKKLDDAHAAANEPERREYEAAIVAQVDQIRSVEDEIKLWSGFVAELTDVQKELKARGWDHCMDR